MILDLVTTAYAVEILEDDGFWAECGIRRNRSDALQMAAPVAAWCSAINKITGKRVFDVRWKELVCGFRTGSLPYDLSVQR